MIVENKDATIEILKEEMKKLDKKMTEERETFTKLHDPHYNRIKEIKQQIEDLKFGFLKPLRIELEKLITKRLKEQGVEQIEFDISNESNENGPYDLGRRIVLFVDFKVFPKKEEI